VEFVATPARVTIHRAILAQLRRLTVYQNRVMPWLILLGTWLAAGAAAPATAASGLGGVLNNSPFTQFTEADYQQFFAAVGQAAEGPVGGPAVNWANAASGARGSVNVLRAFQRPEGDCRDLRGENTARGRSRSYRVTVCRAPGSQWRLMASEPPPSAAPPKPAAAAAPVARSDGFPTTLPASFSGMLPCADCPGLQYHIEFHDDGSYRMRMTYLERGANGAGKDVDDAGAWQLVLDGQRVTLRSDQNTTTTFAVRNPDTLRLLDKNGKEISSGLNYDLKRATPYTPIEPAH
jgi:surface antigen